MARLLTPRRAWTARGLALVVDLAQWAFRPAALQGYPGIVASHVLMFELTDKAARHERMRTRQQLQRIAGLGGMVAVVGSMAIYFRKRGWL